jgi:transposase
VPSARLAWPRKRRRKARTLQIEKVKRTIKKLRHEQFGQSSERGALLDQRELQLTDLEENAVQAETTAQLAAAERWACEAITQPPAPSHPIAPERAAPKLLAHILFAKYGLHPAAWAQVTA